MEGVFACPECGLEIEIQGLSPGRETRCDWCSALVEVPFIPRAEQIKRLRTQTRGSLRFWPRWVWCVIVLLCFMIVAAGLNLWIQSRWRSEDSDSLAKLLATSAESERSGRLDEALVRIEGALALLKKGNRSHGSTEFAQLKERRDALARREFMLALGALRKSPPNADSEFEPLIGQGLNLLARTRSDDALADLEEQVVVELDRVRQLSAESAGRRAEAAVKQGDYAKAAELSERQFVTSEQIPAAGRISLQGMARSRVESIINSRGLMVEFAASRYTLGSDKEYSKLLIPSLQTSLIKAGYFPKPSKTIFENLWRRPTPFRVVIEVTERQDGRYYQSSNRLSILQARLEFLRGDERLVLRTANTQSAVPLPGLASLVANRAALSTQRSNEFERMLYDNARNALIDRLALTFKSLPRFDGR